MPERPKVGDAVWVEGVTPQPNGRVVYIDYDSREAIVRFYDSDNTESYDFDLFTDFRERLNQWRIS